MSCKATTSTLALSVSLLFALATVAFADCTATYSFNWYVGDAVADFPAPMTLREGLNGFTYAGFAADGSDLRVKDAEGNLLPHEIEKWDPNGYSIVWVKLPSLSQSATVMLSWGDAEAATSDGSLWDDAFHVFHFGDDPKKDSANGNHTTSYTTSGATNGIVGRGWSCVGDKSVGKKKIMVSGLNPAAMCGGELTAFTISIWLKGKSDSYDNYLLSLRKDWGNEFGALFNYQSTGALRGTELFGSGTGGSGTGSLRSLSKIVAPDYGWHHFAYTYDGKTLRKYLDGSLVGTESIVFSPSVWKDTSADLFVGGGRGNGNPSEGSFDELRFEPVCRDAAWIKAMALTPAQAHDNDDVYVMSFPEYTGTETLTDFPLMVTLDDRLPGLPDNVKKAMRDVNRLYFYTADGQTELPFEMELTPTESGTTATYWVRMPEFGPGTTLRVQTTPTLWTTNQSTATKRYWASDAGAVNTNVWADGKFLHVYHLAVGRYRFDSVPFGANLQEGSSSWRNTSPAVDGPTGRFGSMHTSKSSGMVAYITQGAGVTNRYTLSFWARKDASDFANPTQSYFCQIRHKDSGTTQWGVLTGFHGDGNKFKLWKNGSADGRRIDIPDTGWHHYAWTCDGTTVRGYRDGAEVMTGDALSVNAADMTDWRISLTGTLGTPNYESFVGDIDEFRLEGEPRSADWIKACCQTQFARRGDVARLTPPTFGEDVSATAATAGAITFAADLVCRVPSTLTLHYGASDGGTDASAWANSTPLGTVSDGRVTGTVVGLAADQGVFARFRAVNAYGEAWSQPISGRAMVDVMNFFGYRLNVKNLAEGVTLKDFPLCVRVPAALNPPATPATLRFTDDGGHPLSHEVETWDATGESIVWVRVPVVAKGTKVRMFWGAPFAAADVPVSSVWNSDYEAVYHMTSVSDSSASAQHFTADETPTNGVVGMGRQFTTANGVATGNHPMEGLAGPFTISGWINGSANMGETYLLMKKLGQMQLLVLFGYVPRTVQLCMVHIAEPGSGDLYAEIRQEKSLIDVGDEEWHHFAYAYDGAQFNAYLDGACVQSHTINMTQCGKHPSSQIGQLVLGRSPGSVNLFRGGLDELRLETVGRSAEWVKACYDDQRGALTEMRYYPTGVSISIH